MEEFEKRLLELKENFDLEKAQKLKDDIRETFTFLDDEEEKQRIYLMVDIQYLFKDNYPKSWEDIKGNEGLKKILDYQTSDPIDMLYCLDVFANLIETSETQDIETFLICRSAIRSFLKSRKMSSLKSFIKHEEAGEDVENALNHVEKINNAFRKRLFEEM